MTQPVTLAELQARLDLAPQTTRSAALLLAGSAAARRDQPLVLRARLLAAKALGRWDYRQSLLELQHLLAPLRRARLESELLEALDECGGHAMVLGDLNAAIAHWGDALTRALDQQHGSDAVRALNGIGKVFWILNDHATALHYHCSALDFALPLDDAASLSAAYLCLGYDLITLQRHTVAGIALTIAEPYVAACGNRHWQAEFALYRATVYVATGERDNAASALDTAARLGGELGFYWVLSQASFQAYLLALQNADAGRARYWLERAVSEAARVDSQTLLEKFHHHAYCQYKAMDDAAMALQHFKAYLHSWEHNHRSSAPRLARRTEQRLKRLQNRLELTQRTLENAALNNTLRDQLAQLDTLDTLGRAALTDPLTGLYNRRMLEQQFARLDREPGVPLSLLIADMDHFKYINDHYGHSTGDAVLQRLATLLRQACRGNELIIRFGGEEFVILLPQVRLEQARQIGDRLRRLVASHDWSELTPGLQATLSVGLASAEAQPLPMSELMQAADAALYEAKAAGRNRVHWRLPG
ncbi:GGDEF domain-containing protein [Chitinilyticum litopenaei]|uniref:GGDEF domain-containing protein n=1 Tax=Chitinilyticum litopenaei TaxID=1121276 RepID=UPI00041D7FCF|nr:GGDEF domain-containing protein [Chitinilyticum litopenaei]